MTRVLIVGLANSHPFADARHLAQLRPGVEFVVLTGDDHRASAFLREHPDAQRAKSLDDAVARHPDVSIITLPPAQVPANAQQLSEAGVPMAITKPAVTNRRELEALEAAVAGKQERLFTSSVLRFAPDLQRIPDDATDFHVVANHHIDYWLNPESRWQDEAGGLVPMMGVHAFELLEHLLGPSMRITECVTHRVRDHELASPDVARGMATNNEGMAATFEVNGLSEGQSYEVCYRQRGRSSSVMLGQTGGDDPLGFLTMASHVLAMADGEPSPLEWQRTRCVFEAIATAGELAEGSAT